MPRTSPVVAEFVILVPEPAVLELDLAPEAASAHLGQLIASVMGAVATVVRREGTSANSMAVHGDAMASMLAIVVHDGGIPRVSDQDIQGFLHSLFMIVPNDYLVYLKLDSCYQTSKN
ncbi:hypothetical protein MLD38_016246 [Melastoma candidum]|uniref:Uncharacterized protein n=1 Tax=Melastoma candidum TaxID=119954 RepID=A0ACB9RS97_9MYRT|nr:hypothetical protein MLD38_016246 [Melastoma candidum]